MSIDEDRVCARSLARPRRSFDDALLPQARIGIAEARLAQSNQTADEGRCAGRFGFCACLPGAGDDPFPTLAY
ncbi:hypothetical protein [Pseudomonas sp. CGJS7]|uniref:hypothetical protein n=1 Tax=Pseudomonas sp. CGJS7 TaxID=3109348 RepID=UPI00300B7E40